MPGAANVTTASAARAAGITLGVPLLACNTPAALASIYVSKPVTRCLRTLNLTRPSR